MSIAQAVRRRLCSVASAITVMVLAAAPVTAAHSKPVLIGYGFDFSRNTGQPDQTITADVVSDSVLQGLRSGGISAFPNSRTADYMVDVQLAAVFEPALQSLRIVTGTLSLYVPRPNADDFRQPILLCSYNILTWRAGDAREIALRVRKDIIQQAAQFARECKPNLTEH